MFLICSQVLGHFGLETLSRGAASCVFCDKSNKACNVIKKNIEKTKFEDKSKLYTLDYKLCITELKNQKFDLIFLDPPYESNLIYLSIKEIIASNILKNDGLIIAETDNDVDVINELNELNIDILKIKKYGRVKLLFIRKVALPHVTIASQSDELR